MSNWLFAAIQLSNAPENKLTKKEISWAFALAATIIATICILYDKIESSGSILHLRACLVLASAHYAKTWLAQDLADNFAASFLPARGRRNELPWATFCRRRVGKPIRGQWTKLQPLEQQARQYWLGVGWY